MSAIRQEVGNNPLVPRKTILNVSGASKHYGGVRALTDVDVAVHAGEVLGLVGPNGAGKTTLVDIITGTQQGDGGRVELAGKPLRGSAANRARLGLARTFQHPLVPSELSILEAIVSGITAHRLRSRFRIIMNMFAGMVSGAGAEYGAAAALAHEFGLRDIDRLCGDVTLGELRLIEVTRAVGQDPVVLLLDEPFAGADIMGIEAITTGIRRVKDRGHSIILVDHNVDLVASLADRIVMLDQGTVAFDGDPQECLASEEMKAVYFGGADV